MELKYRKADIDDLNIVTDIAILLFGEHEYQEIHEENAEILKNENEVVHLCFDGEKPVAFAHCTLRYDYVEGTSGGTVGYLEGIYVLPEYRRHGIAKELVNISETWAMEKGCKEFASDCIIDNTDSYNFHLKVGFTEANRIICFTKKL